MIHVMIERYVAEGMLSTYEELCRTALQHMFIAPGFIAAEAFTDVHDPHHRFVLCKWRSMEDWQHWQAHRGQQEHLITQILAEPEKFTLLQHQ